MNACLRTVIPNLFRSQYRTKQFYSILHNRNREDDSDYESFPHFFIIYLPVSLLLFVLFLLLLPFLWFFLAVNIVQLAVAKLGFSPGVAILLLTAVILGSTINIPLYRVESQVDSIDDFTYFWLRQFRGIPLRKVKRSTVVALNVGGGLIPLVLALYQFTRAQPLAIVLVTTIVTLVSYYGAKVVPGIGIQMSPLLAPLTAALSAILIAGTEPPQR